MATDLATGHVIVFGGYAGPLYLGDTWQYDGTNWSAVVGTAPPGRMRSAMACDQVRGATVLYGGINGVGTNNFLAGTWEFTGGVWALRATTHFPPRRFGHAMAYDANHGRVVMFGGRTNAGTIFLQDTWEWDGVDWLPFTPAHAPSNRMGHAMAFDPVSMTVLLFGGLQLGGPFQGDTWSWNGVDWTLRTPAHAPSARADHAMATDLARLRVVLRGGQDGNDLIDTHEWNGSDWSTPLTTVAPGPLALCAMATGPNGRHVVLFGGEDASSVVQNATWRFGHIAEVRSFGVGCGLPPLSLAPVAGSQPLLGQAFLSEITSVPAGEVPFLTLGFSNTTLGGMPLPLDLTSYGMNGCSLYHDLVYLGLPVTQAGSAWTNAFPVPGLPVLAGYEIYLQASTLAPGANLLGLITSNALGLRIGYP
jgi:hypothetical protein